ncbi:MAG TPA: hypothetical protein VLB74_02550 [Flavobacterium sp.]|uniref:hypothetical protein n=1 Tax=Flavobacterium sp. TaxID=239 RepID=UPI002BCBED47|nr:hypothetical protein [Flavobacterium sp.]HSD13508.1 hypothetical protein [Flavobacterium sp.]
MKDATTIKSLLGLSQEEMAMLLGITRVQWALYDSGKRDIPLSAKQRLADAVSSIKKSKSTSAESQKIGEAEKKKKKDWLEREYKATEHKLRILEKKINTTENIRKECFSALEVAHYLELHQEKETITGLAQSIKTRAVQTLNKHSSQKLLGLKIKKETYKMLKLEIEKKLIL